MAHTLLKEKAEKQQHSSPQKWNNAMAPHEIIALEAQVDALDRETAERVTRLVFECSASLDLALLAIEDANNGTQASQAQPGKRNRQK